MMSNDLDTFLYAAKTFQQNLREHTDALLNGDHERRQTLEANKQFAAENYALALQNLRRNNAFLKGLSDEQKQKLQAAQTKLRMMLDENQDALLKAKVVAEKIGEVIIKAARRAASETTSDYSNLARRMPQRQASKAVSLNETL